MLKAGRVVALDTTQNLLSRVRRRSPCALVAARIARRIGSRACCAREGGVHYLGLDDYAELERLLAALRVEGIAIDELALAGDRSRAGVPADHGRRGDDRRRRGPS